MRCNRLYRKKVRGEENERERRKGHVATAGKGNHAYRMRRQQRERVGREEGK